MTTAGRYADGTPSRLLTYVDARTGGIIRREERIQTTDGEGQSLYSGKVDLEVTPAGSSYQLKDATPRRHLHDRHEQPVRQRLVHLVRHRL